MTLSKFRDKQYAFVACSKSYQIIIGHAKRKCLKLKNKMLKFFDYLYYRTCEFYYKREGDSGFRFTAVLVISTMQGFNFCSILLITNIIFHKKIHINNFEAIIPCIILVAINMIRYNNNKYDYEVLKEKWATEEKGMKIKKQRLLIAYIVLSTVLFLGLAIYLGSKKF